MSWKAPTRIIQAQLLALHKRAPGIPLCVLTQLSKQPSLSTPDKGDTFLVQVLLIFYNIALPILWIKIALEWVQLFFLVWWSLKGWGAQPRDGNILSLANKPTSPPRQCLLWGELCGDHKERAQLHLSFIEAAPFCINKYLFSQEGFYSPSARALSRDGGDACSGPCSNVWLIIYLQQNGWERLRQRARVQVCSLIAGVFGC